MCCLCSSWVLVSSVVWVLVLLVLVVGCSSLWVLVSLFWWVSRLVWWYFILMLVLFIFFSVVLVVFRLFCCLVVWDSIS